MCCLTQAPEVLFTPSLVDHEGAGMAEMVFSCIQVAPLLTASPSGLRRAHG